MERGDEGSDEAKKIRNHVLSSLMSSLGGCHSSRPFINREKNEAKYKISGKKKPEFVSIISLSMIFNCVPPIAEKIIIR